jgi:hypothetical protein
MAMILRTVALYLRQDSRIPFMHSTLAYLIGFFLVTTPSPHTAFSQCTNQTTMLPDSPMEAATKPRDFVRFVYTLSSSDSLLIRSHEDTETSIGPYDLGFLIRRNGTTINRVALRNLPQFREDENYSESFTTMAITRACADPGPFYFVTMKYMGDELSPALVFVVFPSSHGYLVSPLPMFSGGTVDVSRADPLHLKVWHNLNEGGCNACKTAYQITEYEVRDGKPVRIRQHRTKRHYSTGQFQESRVRFVP